MKKTVTRFILFCGISVILFHWLCEPYRPTYSRKIKLMIGKTVTAIESPLFVDRMKTACLDGVRNELRASNAELGKDRGIIIDANIYLMENDQKVGGYSHAPSMFLKQNVDHTYALYRTGQTMGDYYDLEVVAGSEFPSIEAVTQWYVENVLKDLCFSFPLDNLWLK